MQNLSMGIEEITLPAIDIVGHYAQGRVDSYKHWTSKVWQACVEDFLSVSRIIKRNGMNVAGVWGLRRNKLTEWTTWGQDLGAYMVGFELKEPINEIPEGWIRWQVPSYKYIVAKTSKENYDKVYEYIRSE